MEKSRIFLIGLYTVFSAFGIASLIFKDLSMFGSIVPFLYAATGFSLARKGGLYVKIIGYITSVILMLFFAAIPYSAYLYTSSGQFEITIIIAGILLGSIGLATFTKLKSSNLHLTRH